MRTLSAVNGDNPAAAFFFQEYLPNLYEETKKVQHSMLFSDINSSLNWSAVEKAFQMESKDSEMFHEYFPCLNPMHPISTTTDLWKGPDHESYICLTGHYLDSNWELQRLTFFIVFRYLLSYPYLLLVTVLLLLYSFPVNQGFA
jgi:hypothetical protein